MKTHNKVDYGLFQFLSHPPFEGLSAYRGSNSLDLLLDPLLLPSQHCPKNGESPIRVL